MNSRDPPVSASSAVGLQMHPATCGCWGSKLTLSVLAIGILPADQPHLIFVEYFSHSLSLMATCQSTMGILLIL